MKKPNLGKLLPVGDTFITTTKRMIKNRHGQTKWNITLNGPLITYEVLRPGDQRFFVKGKRRYLCKILALVELKTGYNAYPTGSNSLFTGPRWWQFSYLVQILEN